MPLAVENTAIPSTDNNRLCLSGIDGGSSGYDCRRRGGSSFIARPIHVTFTPFVELTEKQWDFVLGVNLKGMFLTTKAFIGGMIERQYGRIINLGSVISKHGRANIAHYSSSKFAVLGFTQSLADEYVKQGITANTVCPGIVMTPLHENLVKEMAVLAESTVDEAISNFVSMVPQGRPQTPEDVARMVTYLASDYAEHITGGSFHVDGGMEMR